jgi:hypothetical protein
MGNPCKSEMLLISLKKEFKETEKYLVSKNDWDERKGLKGHEKHVVKINSLFNKLFTQSLEDNYLWHFCPFGVYENHIEEREKKFLNEFLDSTRDDFIKEEGKLLSAKMSFQIIPVWNELEINSEISLTKLLNKKNLTLIQIAENKKKKHINSYSNNTPPLEASNNDEKRLLIEKGVYVKGIINHELDKFLKKNDTPLKRDNFYHLNPEIKDKIYLTAKRYIEFNSPLDVIDIMTRVELEVIGSLEEGEEISIYKSHYKEWLDKFLKLDFVTYLSLIEGENQETWISLVSEEIDKYDVIYFLEKENLRGEGSFYDFRKEWTELVVSLEVCKKLRKRIKELTNKDEEILLVESDKKGQLSVNQCVLLLDRFGFIDVALEGKTNVDKAKIISLLIGKNEKNIKSAIQKLEKKSEDLTEQYHIDFKIITNLLNSME